MLETLKLTPVSVSGSREEKSPKISGSGRGQHSRFEDIRYLMDW